MNCSCGTFFAHTPLFAKCCCKSVCSACVLSENYSILAVYNDREVVFKRKVKCPNCDTLLRRFYTNTALADMAKHVLRTTLTNSSFAASCPETFADLAFFDPTSDVYSTLSPKMKLCAPSSSLEDRLANYLRDINARAHTLEENMIKLAKRFASSPKVDVDTIITRATCTSVAAEVFLSQVQTPEVLHKHNFMCTINWQTISMAFDENFSVIQALAFVLRFGTKTRFCGKIINGFVRLTINERHVCYVHPSAVCVEERSGDGFITNISDAVPAQNYTSSDSDSVTFSSGKSKTPESDDSDDEYEEVHWFVKGDEYAKRLSRCVYTYCELLNVKNMKFNYFANENEERSYVMDYAQDAPKIEAQIQQIQAFTNRCLQH